MIEKILFPEWVYNNFWYWYNEKLKNLVHKISIWLRAIKAWIAYELANQDFFLICLNWVTFYSNLQFE
jgi:hypothetical protein